MAEHIRARARSVQTLGAVSLAVWGVAACGDLDRQSGDQAGQPGPSSQAPTAQPPAPSMPPSAGPSQPPAVSGGTLLIAQDDATAVAADPDRDSVWIINLPTREVRARVRLPSGAEPGRVVEDREGMIHVALRGAGQVAKLDPWTGQVLATSTVCAAPRGLAYDRSSDNLYVACAGGELITLLAHSHFVQTSWYIDTDLRDVAIAGSHLLISRFRSAEVLEVDGQGSLVGRVAPRKTLNPGVRDANGQPVTSSPGTAWRMTQLPSGDVALLHQRGQDGAVSTKPGGYASSTCLGTGIVSTGITLFSGSTVGLGAMLAEYALGVDLAASRDGKYLAVISPGQQQANSRSPVRILAATGMSAADSCSFDGLSPNSLGASVQLIAGAYDGSGELWVQSRDPAALYGLNGNQTIPLTGAEDRSSEGHRIFHSPTLAGLACASCHPEAGEDGRVWNFDSVGARRTPSLRGGLLATAPFHWAGDLPDMGSLMTAVFTGRMAGSQLPTEQVQAIGTWLDGQPELPKAAPRDPQAVARGQQLFVDSKVGCTGCHSGPHLTNNSTVNVGTGGSFQVPTLLGLSARAPYLHTGCAASLIDRFDPACGGGDTHGHTSQLTSAELSDLVAFLQTL